MRPLKRSLRALCALLLLAAGCCTPAMAREAQPPSSRVVIDVPEGFKPARQYSGFVNERLGASIVIVEMPGQAYDQVARGMTVEALAAKGIRNAQAATLARATPYLYMRAEQTTPDGEFAKHMLVFRDGDVTALVTANIRKPALDPAGAKVAWVAAALASAHLVALPAPSRDVFELGYLGPFKPAGKLLGTTRSYTLDGLLEPQDDSAPRAVLIAAPSLDQRPVPPSEDYAEKLLEGLPGIGKAQVEERRKISLGGLEAIEIVATATDNASKTRITLYQALLLPPGGGYYRLVAQIPEADRNRLLPEVRKIAASFRLLG